jgi:hypothetical protein
MRTNIVTHTTRSADVVDRHHVVFAKLTGIGGDYQDRKPLASSSVPVFAPAPAPALLENCEKMMTLSLKFGTSCLAVTSLSIEGDFN